MISAAAFVGARGIDSEPYSYSGDAATAQLLKRSGIDFVCLYLGAAKRFMVENVVNAGLGFMPITFANRFSGSETVTQLLDLGVPSGTTVWLDIEGDEIYPPKMTVQELIMRINAWAASVKVGGWMPGIYVGSPQPLTSDELWKLGVVRYWDAMSREQDRTGALAEPQCGFCMTQLRPSRMWSGVEVDIDFIQQDFRGRLPNWVVAG